MAQRYSANVERLPDHMKESARAYIEEGRSPSGFLRAVLSNDFTDAVGRADATNQQHLDDWATWLFNDIPASAWGSEEKIEAWIEKGGH